MSDARRLSYGLQPPEGTLTAWGARAIFQNGQIDIVWDRTDCFGSEEDRKKLGDWLNSVGLPGIRRIAARDLLPDDEESVEYKSKGYTVKANPRRSFGYVYLVAYPLREG